MGRRQGEAGRGRVQTRDPAAPGPLCTRLAAARRAPAGLAVSTSGAVACCLSPTRAGHPPATLGPRGPKHSHHKCPHTGEPCPPRPRSGDAPPSTAPRVGGRSDGDGGTEAAAHSAVTGESALSRDSVTEGGRPRALSELAHWPPSPPAAQRDTGRRGQGGDMETLLLTTRALGPPSTPTQQGFCRHPPRSPVVQAGAHSS